MGMPVMIYSDTPPLPSLAARELHRHRRGAAEYRAATVSAAILQLLLGLRPGLCKNVQTTAPCSSLVAVHIKCFVVTHQQNALKAPGNMLMTMLRSHFPWRYAF